MQKVWWFFSVQVWKEEGSQNVIQQIKKKKKKVFPKVNSGWAPFSCPCLHLAQEPEEWGDFWFSQDLWKIKPTLEIICCVWAAPGSVQLRELGLLVGFSCQDLARAHKTPTNWNHERFGCRRNKYCTQLGRNHLQSAQRAPQGAEVALLWLQKWVCCSERGAGAQPWQMALSSFQEGTRALPEDVNTSACAETAPHQEQHQWG